MYKSIIIFALILLAAMDLRAQDCITWVEGKNGFIPRFAVPGGKENGEILYIARAKYMGGIHPGKIRKGWDHCCISFDGKEIQINTYEIMVSQPTQMPGKIRRNEPSNVSLEIRRLIETSADEWQRNKYLSSNNVDRLKKSLHRISDIAYNEGCERVVSGAEAIKDYLNRYTPLREETMKKLDELYDTSKDCR